MSATAETRDRETEELRAELAAAKRERDELRVRAERAEHGRNEFRKLYELVLLELERLKRQLFGQKAETVDPDQVQLAFAPVLEALERARTGSETAAEEVVSELEKPVSAPRPRSLAARQRRRRPSPTAGAVSLWRTSLSRRSRLSRPSASCPAARRS